ncbi:MAG TPA: MMPL family transporter [Syntrophorhabdaceae bacterium]|jgi:predicted exporter
MGSFYTIFSRVFEFFQHRRIFLYAIIALVMALSAFALKSIKLSEDVSPLLPDGASDAAIDFRLLQQAPFMQKVVINLKAGPGVDRKALMEAQDTLAGALKMPYYRRVIAGPEMPAPDEFLSWVLKSGPSLMTDKDVERTRGLLTPENVDSRLREIRVTLNSPEGWVMKPLFQADPLQFHLLILEKLRHMNMFKGMVLKENHFISADDKNGLLIAETPIKITDALGAKHLIDYTRGVIDAHRTPGIAVSFLSGHSYTSANAETIKEDLFVILTCASLTILLLLFLFMRNWRAIFVFLVPTSVVCIATAGVLCVYHTISAVTIAFGSVLMGIADDYPIFTYFSLRDMGDYKGEAVARISRPVLLSGVTTMATFSALFFSELPGQRQIAFFSIIGIIASLIFSLVILPHFIRGLPPRRRSSAIPVPATKAFGRGIIIAGWLLLMVLCLWQGSRLKFNGDMRAVSMIPKSLSVMEEQLKQTWGDFRGLAMVFAEGADLESALKNNDRLFSYLKGKVPDEGIISLAPLLPSAGTQEANRRRWEAQWSGANRNMVKRLLEQESVKTGFTPQAFEPFLETLKATPVEVTPEGLRKAGFADVIDSMIVREGPNWRVLTLVPDTPEVAALFENRANTPFVHRFVSNSRFNETISKAMVKNFVSYIIAASIVILVFLSLVFRSWSKVLYAAVPVAAGLIFMFGAMGWRGIEFNLFNIIATILVIGLSVDLGIFMVSRISQGNDDNTNMAVLLGGLTSLVGMGALTLARHPALYSIGISVLLGMCGAIPSALFVVPAFYRSRKMG